VTSTTRRTSLTNILVAINVIAYVWELATGGPNGLGADRGLLYGPSVASGEWWRIVTGAFLHGSVLHIAFNMFALYQVGNIVEQLFGRRRFALIYAVCIVGSGLAVLEFNFNVRTLGASGAIFGLFGALVAVGLRMGKRGRGLIGQVLPVIVINLVFTYTIPGISAAAHVGGLITGLVAGLVLFMVPSRQREAAYAYAFAPADDAAAVQTIEQPPEEGQPVHRPHE
jgi:rhomboid protease GluP